MQLVSRLGDEAKVLAGGQSLVPLLNMRLARPSDLVDINRVRELSGIRVENRRLVIAAATRMAEVERSEVVRRDWPVLARAIHEVGHFQIRNRGTFGGSVAHADPAAEVPAVMVALGGEVVVRSLRGTRVIPAADFVVGVFSTALAPDELVVELRVPRLSSGSSTGFAEFARRHGDFAIAGAVAVREAAGARVVLFGVADRPVVVRLGAGVDREAVRRAVREQVGQVTADLHASTTTRLRVAAEMAAEAAECAA